MQTVTFYGSEMSLFSGKARGYLRWKGVPFEEVQPTQAVMKEELLPAIGWPVIPVIRLPDGTYVQDTADIIDTLEKAHDGPSVWPEGPTQRFVSLLLQLYADEWLVLPAMHYRWNRNLDWIFGEFGRNSAPEAEPEQQYEIGKRVGGNFQAFVPALGINDATIPGVEASYEAFLADFSAHLEHYPYVFGGRPSFADFALLGPLYAHLYRDPASGDLMKRLAPRVADWTERTIAGGTPEDGPLLGGDEIPQTLLPILRRHLSEHLPVLQATDTAFGAWAENAEPGAEVPRGFPPIPFEIGGHKGTQMARTFSLFRLQAALDALPAVPGEKRAALLDAIGAQSLEHLTLSRRLERRNYRLHLAFE
ncbi:MAG: glutathione S-transferase family protein [Pseudomonadota bacterium]